MSFRDRIDPQLRAWYDRAADYDLEDREALARRAEETAPAQDDPAVQAEDRVIPGAPGSPDIKLRCYGPKKKSSEPLPCLLFFHGGGFLYGSVYQQEDLCRSYVTQAECAVIAVDYRLAPQWKAPAPLEDGYAALLWVHDHAAELGVDPDRLAVGGLGAGGNLAAATALMSRDKKGPALCLQMPLYAALDCSLDTASSHEITDRRVWCRYTCERSWARYLNPGRLPDRYDCPAQALDLAGLPPLFSYIGQLDPGRDENITYWNRLMEAGGEVEYHVFPGCFRGFEFYVPQAECSRMAVYLSCAALRRAFTRQTLTEVKPQ